MILKYKGTAPFLDSRFVAQPGDMVEFSEDEGAAKLDSDPDNWEGVTPDGAQRQGGRRLQGKRA